MKYFYGVIYGSIFCIYIFIGILQRKQEGRDPFLKISIYIYSIFEKYKFYPFIQRVMQRDKVKKSITSLCPFGDKEKEIRWHSVEKIRMIVILIFLGNSLSCIVYIKDLQKGFLIDGEVVERKEYGKGATELELIAELEEGKEGLSFTLEEVQYTPEQIKILFEEAIIDLERIMLGLNSSLDEIRSPLNFVHKMEGYPFTITWDLNNYQVMDSQGQLKSKFLSEEGTVVKITAILKYFDFSGEYTCFARILPLLNDEKEEVIQTIQKEVERKEKEGKYERIFRLPKEIEGKKIIWSESFSTYSFLYMGITVLICVLFSINKDKSLEKKLEKRKKQMLLDYPEIITKFSLLLGAGMTLRMAWKKIVGDYEERENRKGGKRYAYEEMKLTYYEMQSGVPEIEAYKRFGKRCGITRYLKFTSLLIQNIKKGTDGMLGALEMEAKDAFEDRKDMARKLGEEASTKLLLPMGMMLGVVLMLIVIPAFLSFQI